MVRGRGILAGASARAVGHITSAAGAVGRSTLRILPRRVSLLPVGVGRPVARREKQKRERRHSARHYRTFRPSSRGEIG